MLQITPIGTIHSPFTDLIGMPVQPKGALGVEGSVVLHDDYAAGLADLDGFSHIYLIYHFHQAPTSKLQVIPFMDDQPRGVFSTRTPLHPNNIGLSMVEVVSVVDNVVTVCGVDVLDGTPLLDIKPYIAHFDKVQESRSGWMTATAEQVQQRRSDDRFV